MSEANLASFRDLLRRRSHPHEIGSLRFGQRVWVGLSEMLRFLPMGCSSRFDVHLALIPVPVYYAKHRLSKLTGW